MIGSAKQSYQDVVVVNVGNLSLPTKKNNWKQNFFRTLLFMLAALLLFTLGYLTCVRAGLIAPPSNNCCFGILELNFDFDLDTSKPDT